MKKGIRAIIAALLSAVMIFALVGCGEMDINKIKGEWTLSTLDGKSIEDRAAELEKDAYLFRMNFEINEKQAVLSGYEGSRTYNISLRSNGFEGFLNGALAFGAAYDGGQDAILLEAIIDGDTCQCVFKRGKTELTGPESN